MYVSAVEQHTATGENCSCFGTPFSETTEDPLDAIFEQAFGAGFDSEEEKDIIEEHFFDAQDEVER